jgi:DNA-directed RNA polymerase specialized sigma24 family protein
VPPATPGDRQRTGSPQPEASKLTGEAFERLLWSFHPGSREAAGEIYQHLRESLIRYFERRRCSLPDELADETLDRVAQKVMTKSIPVLAQQPGAYCRRVARFIYLEYLKKNAGPSKAMPPLLLDTDPDDTRRFECLERCLAELPARDRQFFLEYRQANATGKKEMAAQQGTTRNALSLRAHKILRRLEDCCRRCFERRQN